MSRRKTKQHRKVVTYGADARAVPAAGTVTLTLKPSGNVMSALKRARRLRVLVTVSFTPRGGTRKTESVTVTVTRRA